MDDCHPPLHLAYWGAKLRFPRMHAIDGDGRRNKAMYAPYPLKKGQGQGCLV